ncbi:MAG TPA: hypothetical protein VGN73_11955, partial [Gemmatimonadaceae bacterium]|nr:hypothetical protein [Gemmatimonadaceae bacterium]
MTKDCRNDCVDRLLFPRAITNRPGLSHIRYRLGSYADIREALLRNLDKTPGLAEWTHRGADDPGIALLEGASVLGDILTFYQELYANEAYLRTAHWRDSIADLVRLFGYRLSPGLGGHATFAFEITGDKPVTIPAGFPVKAEVEGLEKPADFETSEPAIGYPWLSRFNVFRPLVQPLVTSATSEFYIDAPDQVISPVGLRQGDRLLVGVAGITDARRIETSEIVVVDSTRVLHGTTLIKIKGALKSGTSANELVAYKIGRTFRHFGHNGPQTKLIPPTKVTATSSTLASTVQPPALTIHAAAVTVQPPQVTKQPPQMTVTPPSMIVPLSGNSFDAVPSFRVTAPTAVAATIHVLPDVPIPAQWKTDRATLTVIPPAMTVQPPPLTITPPPVTAVPQPVTVLPPPVAIP